MSQRRYKVDHTRAHFSPSLFTHLLSIWTTAEAVVVVVMVGGWWCSCCSMLFHISFSWWWWIFSLLFITKKLHWSCVRSSSITSTTPKSKQSRSTFYFVHLQSLTIQSFFSFFSLYKKLYTCAHTKYLYFLAILLLFFLYLYYCHRRSKKVRDLKATKSKVEFFLSFFGVSHSPQQWHPLQS